MSFRILEAGRCPARCWQARVLAPFPFRTLVADLRPCAGPQDAGAPRPWLRSVDTLLPESWRQAHSMPPKWQGATPHSRVSPRLLSPRCHMSRPKLRSGRRLAHRKRYVVQGDVLRMGSGMAPHDRCPAFSLRCRCGLLSLRPTGVPVPFLLFPRTSRSTQYAPPRFVRPHSPISLSGP